MTDKDTAIQHLIDEGQKCEAVEWQIGDLVIYNGGLHVVVHLTESTVVIENKDLYNTIMNKDKQSKSTNVTALKRENEELKRAAGRTL